MDIRWSSTVSFKDSTTDKKGFNRYYINAKNKDYAERITRELFNVEYGLHNKDVEVVVKPLPLDSSDMRLMLRVKDEFFVRLSEEFEGSSYSGFILAFQKFDGFNASLSPINDSYFWFNFLGMTVKAVYKVDDGCYLDTKEVYYKTDMGRKIVARNSWTEFYYYV